MEVEGGHPHAETEIPGTLGPGSGVMAGAVREILANVPRQRGDVSPKVRSALRDLYGLKTNPARLIRALRAYYATVVTEAGRHIAPQCEVLKGSGAEHYLMLWPEGSRIRSDIARRCRLFAEVAFSSTGPCDLFRDLYQAVFPGAMRHANGEYYTPGWVADLVLDRAGFSGGTSPRLLDPSCGSGVFLVHAAHRLKSEGADPLDTIFGFDINPLAVPAARVNLLACLGARARRRRKIPNVFLQDCILGGADGTYAGKDRWFEFVVGNPPWVLWDNLPDDYREQTAALWRRYGLFNLPHTQGRLGGGKKDLAMLFTYAAADRYLAPGGRMAFVINQGIVQSARAGAGFRRFKIGASGDDLCVTRFDDLSALSLFDASARPGVIVFTKGRQTRYPVLYTVWSRGKKSGGLSCVEKLARPVASDRLDAPWEIVDSSNAAPRAVPDPSYTAHTGAYSGGANGVFWIEVLRDNGVTARIRNMNLVGKRQVEEKTATIETRLIYPLLRWRDVGRWRAEPGQHILLVQEPISRKPVPEAVLRANFPRTHSYLKNFEDILLTRKSGVVRELMQRTSFFAMFGVGEYTVCPWKVVWRRMVKEFTAAVVGKASVGGEAKPIVPQETLTFITCNDEAEAHYLCAVLNSPQATAKARSFAVPGGKSFGTPGMLGYFSIQRYDRRDPVHRELADLSRSAHECVRRGAGTASLPAIETRISQVVGAHAVLS